MHVTPNTELKTTSWPTTSLCFSIEPITRRPKSRYFCFRSSPAICIAHVSLRFQHRIGRGTYKDPLHTLGLNLFVSNDIYVYNPYLYTTSPNQSLGFISTLTALSDGQLGLHTTLDPTATLIVVQSRLDPLFNKLFHLLWRPPDETFRVEEGVEIFFDRVKVRIGLDALDKIVL